MMINEHISKDSFTQESCPSYQEKANKVHKKELEDRQALNVPRLDYKAKLDKRKDDK